MGFDSTDYQTQDLTSPKTGLRCAVNACGQACAPQLGTGLVRMARCPVPARIQRLNK
jgi:hypothetical protein